MQKTGGSVRGTAALHKAWLRGQLPHGPDCGVGWVQLTAGSGGCGGRWPVAVQRLGPVRGYAARHDDVPRDTADDVGTILQEWGPRADPGERSLYACSPHRIEMTALLIRDGYLPGHADAALRLLPEWTQWRIEQSGLNGDFAARSRAAALTEAAALVDEKKHEPAAERNGAPFRREE